MTCDRWHRTHNMIHEILRMCRPVASGASHGEDICVIVPGQSKPQLWRTESQQERNVARKTPIIDRLETKQFQWSDCFKLNAFCPLRFQQKIHRMDKVWSGARKMWPNMWHCVKFARTVPYWTGTRGQLVLQHHEWYCGQAGVGRRVDQPDFPNNQG